MKNLGIEEDLDFYLRFEARVLIHLELGDIVIFLRRRFWNLIIVVGRLVAFNLCNCI